MKPAPHHRRNERVGGYLIFAEDQSRYYARQIEDVEAALQRDVLPVLRRAAAGTGVGSGGSNNGGAFATLRQTAKLLADLSALVNDSLAIVTTLQRDARLVAAAEAEPYHQNNSQPVKKDSLSSPSNAVPFHSPSSSGPSPFAAEGEEEAVPLYAALQAVEAHLRTVLRGGEVSGRRLRGLAAEVSALAAEAVPLAYATRVDAHLAAAEQKAMAATLDRALRASSDTTSAHAHAYPQLLAEVAANNVGIARLTQRAQAVEASAHALGDDEARLAAEIAALLAAAADVRRQTEERMATLEREASSAIRSAELRAADRIEGARKARGGSWGLDAAYAAEAARLQEAYASAEFALFEEPNALASELRQLEDAIRRVGQYGPNGSS